MTRRKPKSAASSAAVRSAVGSGLRSSLRLGWAMSMLGAQGLAQILGGRGVRLASLDAVSSAAERQLGSTSKRLAKSAERLRLDLEALWALGVGGDDRRLGASLLGSGTTGARRTLDLLAPVGGPAFERSADVLFAAEHFMSTALEPLSGETPAALDQELLRRAERLLALEPFVGLGRVEGLGHAYGEALHAMGASGELEGATAVDAIDLPDSLPGAGQMPIWTGAALAIARHHLRSGGADESLRRYAAWCQGSAPEESGLMLFEAAGFIAHQLMPMRFRVFDAASAAASLDPALRAAFFHGVGRALYLSPRGLLDSGHPFERAAALRDPVARRNAISGVAWAATLIHLPHPAILEGQLARRQLAHHDAQLDGHAVQHGVAGALTVWLNHLRCHAGEPYVQTFSRMATRGRAAGELDVGTDLERALERARRRVGSFGSGGGRWDQVYAFIPEAEP